MDTCADNNYIAVLFSLSVSNQLLPTSPPCPADNIRRASAATQLMETTAMCTALHPAHPIDEMARAQRRKWAIC